MTKAYSVFNDGDRILLFPGKHTNPLNCGLEFTKNVYFGSLDGDPNQAELRCATYLPAITITGGRNCTINRLTFGNNNGTAFVLQRDAHLDVLEAFLTNSNGIQGGAISLAANASVLFNNALLQGNTAGRGAVVYAVDGATIVNTGNTRVSANRATDKGGAFYVINSVV
jgi:predicted outer membrane repeat protein